jgi:hypothetical protein
VSSSSRFTVHIVWSTFLFGAGLGLIRLAGAQPSVPIAGLVAVAVVAGVTLETLRWKRGRYAGVVRQQVRAMVILGGLIWTLGLLIDIRSADRGAIVIGGSIAIAVVIYTFSFLPHHRGV